MTRYRVDLLATCERTVDAGVREGFWTRLLANSLRCACRQLLGELRPDEAETVDDALALSRELGNRWLRADYSRRRETGQQHISRLRRVLRAVEPQWIVREPAA